MIEDLYGEKVVLDMSSPYVFIGTLHSSDEIYLLLTDVDVHDLRDSSTTREVYVHEARVYGITPNRSRALIHRHQIVSLSKLEDVASE